MASTTIVSIVDDDDAVRTATQTFLLSLGYKATAFASAEDFLKAPVRETTDYLIADIQMPGDERARPAARTGAVTAELADHLHLRISRRTGPPAGRAACLLSKPFDGDMLINCIEKALAAKSHSSA